jgi:hypothetical protein
VLARYPDSQEIDPARQGDDAHPFIERYVRLPAAAAQQSGFSRIEVGIHESRVVKIEAWKSGATWRNYAKAIKDFIPPNSQTQQVGDPKKGFAAVLADSTNAQGRAVLVDIMMKATLVPWELIVAMGYTEFMELPKNYYIPPDPGLGSVKSVRSPSVGVKRDPISTTDK